MLDRDAASGRSGGLTNQVGLLLVAMILGALLPVGVSAFAASRDPLPRSCHAGPPSASPSPGEIVFADQAALLLVEGDMGQQRKLVDYSPAATTAASPSPSASSTASAPAASAPAANPGVSPSAPPSGGSPAAVSPSAGAGVQGPPARFIAAAISGDHKLLAFLVTDPPGSPGLVSLRVIDLSQPAPAVPIEAWSGHKAAAAGRAEIAFLPTRAILFKVPQRFDAPEQSTRLVGVVIPTPSPPRVVQLSPEEQFTASLHASWPETKDLLLPDDRPRPQDRVLGPNDRVAGRVDRRFQSPVTDRVVHQVVTGKLGQDTTSVLCGLLDDLAPVAFSPDGKSLLLTDGSNSHVLDVGGGHSTVFLLRGRVLDWRA